MIHVHICPLDKECRSYGAPPRLYINSVKDDRCKWSFMLALTPRGKMQKRPFNYDDFGWWRVIRKET